MSAYGKPYKNMQTTDKNTVKIQNLRKPVKTYRKRLETYRKLIKPYTKSRNKQKTHKNWNKKLIENYRKLMGTTCRAFLKPC